MPCRPHDDKVGHKTDPARTRRAGDSRLRNYLRMPSFEMTVL